MRRELRASFVDSAGRDQHADEVRGDPGVAGRKAHRFFVVGPGRGPVAVHRVRDRETVPDPGGRRRRNRRAEAPSAPEELPRFPRPSSRDRRPSGPDERLRPQRRIRGRQIGGVPEASLRIGVVAGEEGGVSEPEDRFGRFGEALGEGDVQAPGNVELPRVEGRGRDRQAVPERDPGVRRFVARKHAGAGGEQRKARGGRGRAQPACERWPRIRCHVCSER